MVNKKVVGWHFIKDDFKLSRYHLGKDIIITPGKVLSIPKGIPIYPCSNGLHASVKLIDAMHYAPGWKLCRVLSYGEVVWDDDKYVSRNRKVLYIINAKKVFAKWFSARIADLYFFLVSNYYSNFISKEDKSIIDELDKHIIQLRIDDNYIIGKNFDSLAKLAYGNKSVTTKVASLLFDCSFFLRTDLPRSLLSILLRLENARQEITKYGNNWTKYGNNWVDLKSKFEYSIIDMIEIAAPRIRPKRITKTKINKNKSK